MIELWDKIKGEANAHLEEQLNGELLSKGAFPKRSDVGDVYSLACAMLKDPKHPNWANVPDKKSLTLYYNA